MGREKLFDLVLEQGARHSHQAAPQDGGYSAAAHPLGAGSGLEWHNQLDAHHR